MFHPLRLRASVGRRMHPGLQREYGQMRFRGGYNVPLGGRPSGAVEESPGPDVLHLPLWSFRFRFSELAVHEGEGVRAGQVLARDPVNHFAPLLAPRPGIVRLGQAENHITLEEIGAPAEKGRYPDDDSPHGGGGSAPATRQKLLRSGAWQFLYDAHTGMLPDPFGTPRAVIVSTVALDPFVVRGDVQLREQLPVFLRGLQHIQSLLEYQPIYLVMPDIQSELASQIREMLRGYAWIRRVEVPLRFGLDNFAILARRMGLMREADQPVWALRTEGVLAIDRALTDSLPCTERVISIGGPAVESPVHLKTMVGHPLEAILEGRLSTRSARAINGGVLTGATLDPTQRGLDVECAGLTVLPEDTEREFLGFTRPGWDRRSYSKCFVSSFRKPFAERLTTGLRGERRACISCNACEEVCPAGIMPHLIHKYLYQGALDEAERARVDLCVECGLCSFVCPSKIELRQQFVDAKETIRRDSEKIASQGRNRT
jgi:Na+-transporting NADH:ubiquinone oxidoreductase subunit A